MEKPFHGRAVELAELDDVALLPGAKVVVIKGRRRIGKSRLIQEFGKRHPEMRTYYLTSPPPVKATSNKAVIKDFTEQMERVFESPPIAAKSWNDILQHICDRVKDGNAILVLDEINWLGHHDQTFPAKIWTIWETRLSKLDNFILILSGSLAGWIDDKFSNNTGYLGRISWNKTIRELPIQEAVEFFGPRNDRLSSSERLKLLMITGGIPRYLEDILPQRTAEENISRMCFNSAGLLFKEYDQLLNDLFQRKNNSYRAIIEALAERPMTVAKLHSTLHRARSGVLSTRIEELEKAGFLTRHHTWDTQTGEEAGQFKIRLSDNYLRFYLKAINPHVKEIEAEEEVDLSDLPGKLGLQFENLVIKNRRLLLGALRIRPREIVRQGPYFQTKTTKHASCQIDYLIQTRHSLYVVEIKFLNEEVGLDVARAVQQKIDRLVRPKGLAVRPALVHVNGVETALRKADFFDRIIDYGKLAFG